MNDSTTTIAGVASAAGATQTQNVGSAVSTPLPSPQNRSQRVAPVITCSGCDNTWTGQGRMHCSGCHRLFAGLGLFDAHRRDVRGSGTCLDPATLPAMRLDNGVWRGPEMTDEQKAKRFG